MNNNDFLNKLRILFGGEENWTDQPEDRTYRAANDTSLYNTDMRDYRNDDAEYAPQIDGAYSQSYSRYRGEPDAWATTWSEPTPFGTQVRFRKDPGKDTVTETRYTFTANDGGDSIDSMGNVRKGERVSNVNYDKVKNEEAKAAEQKNGDFISILRGLFGLFDNKK